MSVAIRPDLAEAHRLAWEHIAAPGSWWTGAERIELAGTALLAITDPDPSPPWVPATTTARLPADRTAPDAAHDVVYRISRHGATMTEAVYRQAAAEIGALPYVELCGIASTVAAVVHFRRNVGLDVPPLPRPIAGRPTGEQPQVVVDAELNWVKVADPADRSAAVMQAYTAVPGTWENNWRLADAQYMSAADMRHPDWMRRPDGLTRAQMELVAARVAQLRECFY